MNIFRCFMRSLIENCMIKILRLTINKLAGLIATFVNIYLSYYISMLLVINFD